MSVSFSNNRTHFLEEYAKIDSCFEKDIHLPNQIFKKKFTQFWFAEFDVLLDAKFGKFLKDLLIFAEQNWVTLISIYPDHNFLKSHFDHYGIIRLERDSIEKTYGEALRLIPKQGTIADSLLYNVREIAIVSNDCNWCIYGDRISEFLILASEMVVDQSDGDFLKEVFFPIEQAVSEPIGNAFSDFSLTAREKTDLLHNYMTKF